MITRTDFINKLYSTQLKNCFNPYMETCPVYDKFDAVQIRRSNFEALLNAAEKSEIIDLWVGRDLGYRGGRRTGLALADEFSLDYFAFKAGAVGLQKSTTGPSQKERTATVIRQALDMVDVPILTWNVFPFHPHVAGNPFSNRMHSKSEFKVGLEFLKFLCKHLNIRNAVGIGNDAYSCLATLRPECLHARHPSYGGQADFLDQMRRTYLLNDHPKSLQGELKI